MKYSGVFYVNNSSTNLDTAISTANSIAQGVENSFPTATRQAPWSLQYRVFRDTIPPGHVAAPDADGKPTQYAHTYQHIIHNSSIDRERSFICIQPPTGTSTVSGIPLKQQEAHASLVRHQFAALWQPRHVVSLPQGVSYAVGLFIVQVGELRSIREGPQSGATLSPGVAVCISTKVGVDDSEDDTETLATSLADEEDIDFEYAQAIIRDCWNKIKEGRDLGKSEVREAMMAQDNVGVVREKEAAVRMWCEILRSRS